MFVHFLVFKLLIAKIFSPFFFTISFSLKRNPHLAFLDFLSFLFWFPVMTELTAKNLELTISLNVQCFFNSTIFLYKVNYFPLKYMNNSSLYIFQYSDVLKSGKFCCPQKFKMSMFFGVIAENKNEIFLWTSIIFEKSPNIQFSNDISKHLKLKNF